LVFPLARIAPRALLAMVLLVAAPAVAWAASAPFDLQGPRLHVTVTRAGQTLPIAETPNLAEGDHLSIKADLPKTQSVHYLLVAGFLRGVTNPPSAKWFFQSQTWNPRDEAGLSITVPQGAQQLLVFLAPETGGDFKTLVSAARQRPGAFVRASQDLNQASLDHARLTAFLAAIGALNQDDPARLKTASPLLARSLAIKLDAACLTKTADMQAACLTQGQDSLILNDGHSTSMVQALSSGYSAELIQELSATPRAGGGYFSPYVASVLDIAHIMDSFHTAQYQYIPALGAETGASLALLLNAPPSFQDPKSVLVVAFPAIEPAQPPPLHAIDPNAVACLQKPDLVLPVEGAPLVFSTAYAHDLVLHLKTQDGKAMDLPVRADARQGGLVVDTAGLDAAALPAALDGSIQGSWGFDPYAGPIFHLQNARPQTWRPAAGDEQALVAGRVSVVHLQAQAAGCVQSVTVQAGSGALRPAEWKATGPDRLTVTVPLEDVAPGPVTLSIQSNGAKMADIATLTAYAAAGRLQGFVFHAGDQSGVLSGAGLDRVASIDLDGVTFTPDHGALADPGGGLTLTAKDAGAAAKLKAGQTGRARVKLKDGRVVALATTVGAPRPGVALIGKSVQPAASEAKLKVELTDPEELPHDAQLTFSIRALGATTFSGSDKIELAAEMGASTTLAAADGGFTLQNAQVAVATVDLAKALGSSAFGPLRFRLIDADGPSEWQRLGVLVRAPALRALNCPAVAGQPCLLSGSDLFLIQSIASTPRFTDAIQVPEGFPGAALSVPRPKERRLYVKLSDDPEAVDLIDAPGIEVHGPRSAGTP
jgi:hypothetical protein